MRTRHLIAGLLGFALLGIVAPASAQAPLSTQTSQAPRFKVRALSGEMLDLEKLRQKGPVLLDFWATWCKPCLAAIPDLVSLHKEFGPRGLTVIGVSTDGPNNYSKVRPFAARLGIKYPVSIDQDGTLAEKYQVRAMPTTLLIDTTGVIVKVHQGYRPGEGTALREAVRALFDETSADSSGTEPTEP